MTVQVEKVLSDIIKIQSVNPPGGETAVANYLKMLFDEYKIPCEIIEPSPGRGSFIATSGTGEKSMLFFGHTDVVPVAKGWSFDPFGGENKDGFVQGRGAIDCKGLIAAEACAFINLVDSGKLRGKLIFAAVADEETGGTNGAGFIIRQYPSKIRADFAINEGASPLRITGRDYQSIGIGEKAVSWLKLTTRGIAGHGSVPIPQNNAVIKMARAINAIANYKPAVILKPETNHLIQTISEITGHKIGQDPNNIDNDLWKLPDVLLMIYLMVITRMTVSPNVVHGGVKTNIVPDLCETQVDVRVLPGQDWDYVVNELKPLVGDAEIEPLLVDSSTFSGVDNEYYKLIESTLKEFTGDYPVLPYICSGTTDSRFLLKAGIPTYGIDILTMDSKLAKSVHGIDEKIDIASLQLKTNFLMKVAEKYLGA